MKNTEEMKKLKSLNENMLREELIKEKLELDKLSLAVSARKEDNTSLVNKSRKRVARINTLLAQHIGESNE